MQPALTLKRSAVALLVPLALLLTAPAARAVSFRSADGLALLSSRQLDARLFALQVHTAALPRTLGIRILLPDGYAAHPRRRYPVLYLLDGTSGTAADWTTAGGAEQTTAGRPLIVVMPDITIDGNGGGWCTNWPNGAESWETFHIDELIPWVQANLRTLDSRGERAIAGLSQGGFCSMSYAARHPDLFGIALAYSGAPDIAVDPAERIGALTIINATEVGLDQVPADSMFGDPVSDFLNYAAHDPTTLAPNLRWTRLYMYFGNGLPGPYDTNPLTGAYGELLEGVIAQDNIAFEQRLRTLGIVPAVYDPYGNGTHSWPYWARDLRWSLPAIMADFAHPAPAPTAFTYTTASASYSLYGWSVAIERRASEFSTLETNGARGFVLQGSGTASVSTPAIFRRGAAYRVTIGSASGAVTSLQRSSSDRRLRIEVPLGPADTRQEYADGPGPTPWTHVSTADVTISPR
jgi:S-formylglutathione hydrolase FrmB